MQKAFINPVKCLRCSTCEASAACPVRAIFRIAITEPSIVDPKFCHGCGDCVAKCPGNAVILKNN